MRKIKTKGKNTNDRDIPIKTQKTYEAYIIFSRMKKSFVPSALECCFLALTKILPSQEASVSLLSYPLNNLMKERVCQA